MTFPTSDHLDAPQSYPSAPAGAGPPLGGAPFQQQTYGMPPQGQQHGYGFPNQSQPNGYGFPNQGQQGGFGFPGQPTAQPPRYTNPGPGGGNPFGQHKGWTVGGILAAVAVVVVLASGALTGSSSPKGFNDPVKLGADMSQQITGEQTDGSSVDITCIHISGTQFTCHAEWSDDTPSDTVTVTVPADGSTWISGH